MGESFEHTRQHDSAVTHVGGLLLVIAAAVLAYVAASFTAQYLWFRASDLYSETMSIVGSSEELKAKLGDHITAGWPLVRRAVRSSIGEVSVRMPLRGERGEATLQLQARSGGHGWEYQHLEARMDSSQGSVTLTPAPWRRQELALRGSGQLYFVAIGELARVNVNELARTYENKYGVQITVLSPLSYNGNRERATRMIDVLKAGFPKLVADPRAVVIGITDVDMDWYSWRDDERFAVVSTSGLASDQFHKQVSKNVGLLWFELPISSDWRSVLYDGVNGTGDLDRMSNDF